MKEKLRKLKEIQREKHTTAITDSASLKISKRYKKIQLILEYFESSPKRR